MGLIAKNIVTKPVKPVAESNNTPVESNKVVRVESKVITRSVPNINRNEPAVIVNGKVKKISKKSAFLLDMLSLDD